MVKEKSNLVICNTVTCYMLVFNASNLARQKLPQSSGISEPLPSKHLRSEIYLFHLIHLAKRDIHLQTITRQGQFGYKKLSPNMAYVPLFWHFLI